MKRLLEVWAPYWGGMAAVIGLLWPFSWRELLAVMLFQAGLQISLFNGDRARGREERPYRWFCPSCPLMIESNDAVYVARWSEQHQARHS